MYGLEVEGKTGSPLDRVGSRRLAGIQGEMLFAARIFSTGIEEDGLGSVSDPLGLGLCAGGQVPKVHPGTLECLEVREIGRGGWRDSEGEKHSDWMCGVPLSSG